MASKIRIQHDDEFGKLLRGLAQDIVDAHIHWNQYLALQTQMDKSPHVAAEAYTFWHYTLIAHQRAALMCLARAFDDHNDALHLRSWLSAIRDHLHLFGKSKAAQRRPNDPFAAWISENAAKPDPMQLDLDIKSCSRRDDPDAQALNIFRDNLLAHRNADLMKEGDPAKLPPLLVEQVDRLLARAITLLNRYAYMFETSMYGTQPIGHDHVERVFAYVQCVLDQIECRIETQVAALTTQTKERPNKEEHSSMSIVVYPVERMDIVYGDYVREPVLMTREAFDRAHITYGHETWPWRLLEDQPQEVDSNLVHNGRFRL
jgi:hypothetical protein